MLLLFDCNHDYTAEMATSQESTRPMVKRREVTGSIFSMKAHHNDKFVLVGRKGMDQHINLRNFELQAGALVPLL